MSQSRAHANDVPAEVPAPGHRRALANLFDSLRSGFEAVLPALLLVAAVALVVVLVQAVAGALGLLVVGFALAVGAAIYAPFVVADVVASLVV